MHNTNIKYVPIDFIKTQVIGIDTKDLLKQLEGIEPKSIYKGELLTKTIYKHKNLSIKFFENNNRIELSGSLHTYFNEGLHNHNDFSLTNFRTALNLLYHNLKIKPENLYIIHLEWGYNIEPPYKTNNVIDNIIQHKCVNKTLGIDSNQEGKYSEFKHAHYRFKIYNKAKHFKLNKELIRFEIKQTNWSKFRAKNIFTLKDFINSDATIFLNELLEQINNLVIYDLDINNQNYKYQTPKYWNELRQKYSYKTVKYHKDKLNKLSITEGLNTKQLLINSIIKKGKEIQL